MDSHGGTGNFTMNFKVSELILREFTLIAKKNFSINTHDPGHIETMSILVGHETVSGSETVVSKLIFVDQIGAPYQVTSEGNFELTIFGSKIGRNGIFSDSIFTSFLMFFLATISVLRNTYFFVKLF